MSDGTDFGEKIQDVPLLHTQGSNGNQDVRSKEPVHGALGAKTALAPTHCATQSAPPDDCTLCAPRVFMTRKVATSGVAMRELLFGKRRADSDANCLVPVRLEVR
jgi:hypothetical protein